MMLTIPFVLYGIFRLMALLEDKESGEAPEEILLSDRPIQLAIFLWVITILVIFYMFPKPLAT